MVRGDAGARPFFKERKNWKEESRSGIVRYEAHHWTRGEKKQRSLKLDTSWSNVETWCNTAETNGRSEKAS